MITRVPDGATRAESVAWDKLVFTVAVGDDNSLPMYEQAKQAFATIDKNWSRSVRTNPRSSPRSSTSRISARSRRMNRAWDEWADRANPPMRACLAVTLEGRDLVEVLVTAVRG